MGRVRSVARWILYVCLCYVILLGGFGAIALLTDHLLTAREAQRYWHLFNWFAVPALVAWFVADALPARVWTALSLLSCAWIVWSIGQGIRAWWREREEAAIARHRMVLIRLDHLEERVKRLGRSMQDPDTLADDAEDAFHEGGTE